MTLAASINTSEWLSNPALAELIRPVLVTGVAIAVLCAPLSLLVVLKRLAFIGQGVSHAAFGGWGIASILAGASATGGALAIASRFAASTGGQLAIVYAFCLLAAMVVAWMSGSNATGRRRAVEPDTAIGIVLVASMALGALLNRLARNPRPWESFLFGSVLECGPLDAVVAVAAAALVLLTLWLARRRLIFWAFDEPAAVAFGVHARAMNAVLMALLALATVVSMRLVGVVPATALLVLPGATALRFSRKWGIVMVMTVAIALVGVLVGLVASLELDLLPGSSIVLALTALYAATAVAERLMHARQPG